MRSPRDTVIPILQDYERASGDEDARGPEAGMSTRRPAPGSELFELMYGELRRVARRYLGRERRNHTLQPTALVHEAWMKLQNERGAEWQGRTHGLALAAQAMRRLLVDHGRHQKREKRGGGVQPVVARRPAQGRQSTAGGAGRGSR